MEGLKKACMSVVMQAFGIKVGGASVQGATENVL